MLRCTWFRKIWFWLAEKLKLKSNRPKRAIIELNNRRLPNNRTRAERQGDLLLEISQQTFTGWFIALIQSTDIFNFANCGNRLRYVLKSHFSSNPFDKDIQSAIYGAVCLTFKIYVWPQRKNPITASARKRGTNWAAWDINNWNWYEEFITYIGFHGFLCLFFHS